MSLYSRQFSVGSFQYLVGSCSKQFVFFVALLISFSVFSQGFKIPEKPKFQTSVYDYINLLSSSQKSSLEHKLIRYSDTTSTQIVVAIIETTNRESIGILTPRWAHEWGIGQEKEDNGVFILLAEKDRKVWISPGYGVEHKLTAGITGEIVRNNIIPEFKKGDYYKGLDNGVEAIFNVLNGTYKGTRKEASEDFDFGIVFFIIIIVLIVIIISKGNKNNRGGGRRYRRHNTNRDIFETIILSNSGRSGGFGGFGGSSSSGGGFSSGGFGGGFGGGGFSGGGAGGSW